MFEMFSQVRSHRGHAEGGLGIGLSLVRQLVEMHGGSVQVESPGDGGGSTFSVRLPLTEPAAAVPEATQVVAT
jgi:signal transduction histidine kinase